MKVREDGFIEIKTDKDAVKALTAFRNLKEEIDELRKESGLLDLEQDAVAYKAALTNYMVEKDVEQIQGDGFHGTLVKSHDSPRWIGTDDDLRGDEPDRVETLQAIIERKCKSKISKPGSKARKLWFAITKRVLDPGLIEEAVNEKLLTVDEISPAFFEKERAPYLRVFEDV